MSWTIIRPGNKHPQTCSHCGGSRWWNLQHDVARCQECGAEYVWHESEQEAQIRRAREKALEEALKV